MPRIESGRAIHTGWLTGASYGGMFVFGIVMAVIGALLPRLAIGFAQAGNVFLVLTFSMLVSMLCLGPLMDRFGKKLPLAFGALLVAAALALMAGSRSYDSLLLAVVFLGAGGGALNGGANLLIADLHSDPRRKNSALNLLGVFYGFGALFLPFVIGSLVDSLGLAAILWIAAVPTTAVSALFFLLAFPEPVRAEGLKLSEVGSLARNPLVLLFGFLLFFQSGNEFLVGGYTATLLTRELQFSLSTASYLLAAYWASIMVARLLLSRLLLKANGPGVVMVSGIGTAAGVLLLALSQSGLAAAAGIVLIGVSFASVYPTVLGQAGARFEHSSGTVFGILFAIALTGGMLMPWAAGQLAEYRGLRLALGLGVFCGLMVFALQAAVARRAAQRSSS